MIRLLKLAVAGLLGYAAYEFIRGMTDDDDGGNMPGTRGPQSPALGKALGRAGRSGLTGPGRGHRVTTEETTGESVPHLVGRGVVTKKP